MGEIDALLKVLTYSRKLVKTMGKNLTNKQLKWWLSFAQTESVASIFVFSESLLFTFENPRLNHSSSSPSIPFLTG